MKVEHNFKHKCELNACCPSGVNELLLGREFLPLLQVLLIIPEAETCKIH